MRNRRQRGGGGRNHAAKTTAAAVLTPPGSPVHWYDFTNISMLWKDTSLSIPVTTDGDSIAAITDQGSRISHADTDGADNDNPPIWKENQHGTLGAGQFIAANSENLESVILQDPYVGIVTALSVATRVAGAIDPNYIWGLSSHAAHYTTSSDRARANNVGAFDVWSDVSNPVLDGVVNATLSRANTSGTHHIQWTVEAPRSVEAAYTGPMNTNSRPFTIGTRGGLTKFWDGEIFEIILWANEDVDLEAIRDYVVAKYGLDWPTS